VFALPRANKVDVQRKRDAAAQPASRVWSSEAQRGTLLLGPQSLQPPSLLVAGEPRGAWLVNVWSSSLALPHRQPRPGSCTATEAETATPLLERERVGAQLSMSR
jgi:hypothetical protein